MNLPLHASPSALSLVIGAAHHDPRTELVDALRTTNEAIALAVAEFAQRGEAPPLCLTLAAERNRRLIARAEAA